MPPQGAWLVVLLLLAQAWLAATHPIRMEQDPSHQPFSAISEHVAARVPRLQEQPRLPLPTTQDLEAIKKVAQILITLGEQVIPTIIGEPPTSGCGPSSLQDVPPDPVIN